MNNAMKIVALSTALLVSAVSSVFAQGATTLGGGPATRVDGGAAEPGMAGNGAGMASPGVRGPGEVGGRAESAAKGNDPTGVNGATNNRY